MNAKFSTENGVEMVELSGGYMEKDVVKRAATEADKRQYRADYEAFKSAEPEPAAEPKAESKVEPATAPAPPKAKSA